MLARRLEQCDPRPDEALAPPDRAHWRHRCLEAREPLAKRASREVLAIEVEDVKDLVDDRRGASELPDGRVVAHMHPRLQPLESRNPLLVERDDLAVDDRLVSTGERFGDLRRLRVLARAVEEVARLKAHLAAVDEGEGAYPVPFGFVDELR